MRWRSGRRSRNVEDRRGRAARRAGVGGIGALILVLVAVYLGVDPALLLDTTGTGVPGPPGPGEAGTSLEADAGDELADFTSRVLAFTEDTWRALFADMGRSYQEPRLVLFSGSVSSACGYASAAVGPFYCPADGQVYIDLGFYDDLRARFGAPGDFAQAYVIAHEVGHHVQNLMGISGQVHRLQRDVDEAGANALSVRLELQADCLAGVWAHHTEREHRILEAGDVEEALGAAAAIGDDRLQMQSRGYVAPESFTHGTAEQRVRWFRRGLDEGDLSRCDTFSAGDL